MIESSYPVSGEVAPGMRRPGIRLDTDPADGHAVIEVLLMRKGEALRTVLCGAGFAVVPLAAETSFHPLRTHALYSSIPRTPTSAWHQDHARLLVLHGRHGIDGPADTPLAPMALTDARSARFVIAELLPGLRTATLEKTDRAKESAAAYVRHCIDALGAGLAGGASAAEWSAEWDTLFAYSLRKIPALWELAREYVTRELAARNALYVHDWNTPSALIIDDVEMFHGHMPVPGSEPGVMERLQRR